MLYLNMEEISNSDIGRKIRLILVEKDIKKKEFAYALKISAQRLSGYLNGSRTIPMKIARRMAEHLKMTLDELLNWKSEFLQNQNTSEEMDKDDDYKLTERERKILEAFRQLPEINKKFMERMFENVREYDKERKETDK